MKVKLFNTYKIVNLLLLLFFLFSFSLATYSSNQSQKQSDLKLESEYKQQFALGEESQKKGHFEGAAEYFSAALSQARKTQNPENECVSLLKLGLMYWNMGILKESTEFYINAQDIAKKYDLNEQLFSAQSALAIYTYYNEGKKFRQSGDHIKSIENFQKAIEIAKEINSKEHELKCSRHLGLTYYLQVDWKNYYLSTNKALRLAKTIKHKVEEGYCLNNLGVFFDKVDNYERALKCYDEASKIAKELELIDLEFDSLNNISIIYKELGNFEKSTNYLEKVLAIDKELGEDLYIGKTLNNLGATYRQKGITLGNEEDLSKALEYFKTALKKLENTKDEATKIQILNNLGTVNSDLENYYEALENFKSGYIKAEKLNDIESMGMILNNMGIVHSNEGNYGESSKYFQQAIELAEKMEGGKFLWEAYLELARTRSKQGNYIEAIKKYRTSINQIENIRSQIDLEELKESFLSSDKRIEAYHELINILIKLNDLYPNQGFHEEAFNYMERAKARVFLDMLEISEVEITQEIDFKLQNQEKELLKDISNISLKLYASEISNEESENLNKELKEKEYEYESLKREIRAKSPDYINVKYPEIITFDETQKNLLDSKTAIFEYSIGKETSLGFVITKNDYKTFSLPNREQLQLIISDYLGVLSDKENQDFKLGHKLYKILVKPGLKENIKNVIFVADDILHYLPFETLISSSHGINWLIHDLRIAYVPSISSLREIIIRKKAKKRKPKMDLLALGDPNFELATKLDNQDETNTLITKTKGREKSRLKYSGIEINNISELFNKKKIKTLVRDSASEENLKDHNLEVYKIIHFATHSLIDNNRPYGSYILLAINEDPKENDYLQAREIYNLKLNADLVTLSACETGLGKFIKGEGIEGLNRAFFYAGTSSVMMSLWPVNDQATYQLMERFYIYLRSSKSIMKALRKAKLEMIASEKLNHPYYWASFIISGKADHVVFPASYKSWIVFGSLLLVSGLIFLVIKKNGNNQK